MRSACAVAFVIGLTVQAALGSDPSEAALEEALQHDDTCANNDGSKCSVELLQRAVVEGRIADSVEAEEGQGQAEDEVEGECCRWGNRRTCTQHRHCQGGHCTTTKHCSNQRYCKANYRNRRTCTKHRHCQGGTCTTRKHCSNQRYCGAVLLQDGEAATEHDLDANEEEGEEVMDEDGSADAGDEMVDEDGDAATDDSLDANEGEDGEMIEEDGSADAADEVVDDEGEAATENDLDANKGEDVEVIEDEGSAKELVESDQAGECPIAEQGTTCSNDSDCEKRTACCQDVVARKIGVKPCHQCTQTCHPKSHKCKCN